VKHFPTQVEASYDRRDVYFTYKWYLEARQIHCWLLLGYAIKIGLNSQVNRLKARFAAKGYTQIFGLDYNDTFSPKAKITCVPFFYLWLLLIMVYLDSVDMKIFKYGMIK